MNLFKKKINRLVQKKDYNTLLAEYGCSPGTILLRVFTKEL